jgi:hypothetical protein
VKKTSEPELPPVFFRIHPHEVLKKDLAKELKINLYNLDGEMKRAATVYMWWAGLYAEISARVSKLEEKLEKLEADLFKKYAGKGRITDIKHSIAGNHDYYKLRKVLRKWKDSERILKFAEKAMDRRIGLLQSLNANQRKEKENT